MVLTEREIAAVLSLWIKVTPLVNDLGGEALERLFLCYPQTKIYFTGFDLTHGSSDIKEHGGKVLNALGNAAAHLEDLSHALSTLTDLQENNIRVDPRNYGLLSHMIQVVLATRFPDDFTPEVQAAWNNFLEAIFNFLKSKHK